MGRHVQRNDHAPIMAAQTDLMGKPAPQPVPHRVEMTPFKYEQKIEDRRTHTQENAASWLPKLLQVDCSPCSGSSLKHPPLNRFQCCQAPPAWRQQEHVPAPLGPAGLSPCQLATRDTPGSTAGTCGQRPQVCGFQNRQLQTVVRGGHWGQSPISAAAALGQGSLLGPDVPIYKAVVTPTSGVLKD